MYVISSFTILWLMVINPEVSKVWGLLTHDQVVIKFLPFVAIFYYVKHSRNIHEILLPGYFREELTQRIWGSGVAQEVPTRSFTKRFSMITQIWGELRQTEEKAMAPHSSTLAWKIPWTEQRGRLQYMGSLRVRHDWATSLSLFTFHFHALEKEMATHSSVLAWRIPGTGEPGRLPSMGSHRVGHDWSDLA